MSYGIGDPEQRRDRPSAPVGADRAAPPAVDAEALFKGNPVLVIEFQGERYQLRKTRNGKLILTK